MYLHKKCYFVITVRLRQFLPLVGKSLLKWAPTLPSRSRAERVMSVDVVIMFLSSKMLRSGPWPLIVVPHSRSCLSAAVKSFLVLTIPTFSHISFLSDVRISAPCGYFSEARSFCSSRNAEDGMFGFLLKCFRA